MHNKGVPDNMLHNIDNLIQNLTEYIEKNYQAPAITQELEIPSEYSDQQETEKESCEITVVRKETPRKHEGKGIFKKYDSSESVKGKDLKTIVEEVGETFHEFLFRKIEERGMTPAEVYHRANMDRKLFSKIRSNPAYHPSKSRVLDLAIALRLTGQETVDLMSRAEYAFSPCSRRDLIIRFFIEKGIYDQETINYALLEFGEDILGDQQSRRTRE